MEVGHAGGHLHYVEKGDGLDWSDLLLAPHECEFDEGKDLDYLQIYSNDHVPKTFCSKDVQHAMILPADVHTTARELMLIIVTTMARDSAIMTSQGPSLGLMVKAFASYGNCSTKRCYYICIHSV